MPLPIESPPLPWHDLDYWTLPRLRKDGYWHNGVFRAVRFRAYDYQMPTERPISPEALSKKINYKLSLDRLISGAANPLRQLLYRACTGDEQAIFFLIKRVCNLTRQIETLVKFQPDKVRTCAERYERWPMLLSLNPQDIAVTGADFGVE